MMQQRPYSWSVSPLSDNGVGEPSSALWKSFTEPRLACSSAIVGGGLLAMNWVVNATVATQYLHPDPVQHALSIVRELGLVGDGACLLTAVDVEFNARFAAEEGVIVMATAGITSMGWAAVPAAPEVARPGTINIVVEVPEPVSPAALVNLVMTTTEAKAQYFAEAGHPATGTPTDAVVVLCPQGPVTMDGQYGGPRSRWGAVVARAVLAALHARDRKLNE